MSTERFKEDLGVGEQATRVLAAVNRERFVVESGHLETSAWYNGRECGVCFSAHSYHPRRVLRIAVFDHRNSDDICALRCEEGEDYHGLNPPTFATHGKLFYPKDSSHGDLVKVEPMNHIMPMAEWVVAEVRAFLEEARAEREKAKGSAAYPPGISEARCA